jgi:hypothetical protein
MLSPDDAARLLVTDLSSMSVIRDFASIEDGCMTHYALGE